MAPGGVPLAKSSRTANGDRVSAVIAQGETWWADLGEPVGSAPGFRRPILVVQGDALNQSRISTVICVPLMSNLKSNRSVSDRLEELLRHVLLRHLHSERLLQLR
jgi:mRNA-degrading endonuclease toxin of MazEF toxin-antitoxin module